MGRPYLSQTIQHDSHAHPLHFDQQPSPTRCAACGNPTTPPSNHAYSCKPCNYTLHASCGTLPNVLSHPSHPPHDLELLLTPAYPEGSFDCDACGVQGTAFSYHCEECSVDLHSSCALLPSSFLHPSHFHPLTLAFSSPYEDRAYTCNVCGNVGDGGRWLYRCSTGCDFDAHLHCIVVAAPSRGLRFQQAQRSAQQPLLQQSINPQQQQRRQLQQNTVPHPIPRQQPPQQWVQPRPQQQPIPQRIPGQRQRGLELRPQEQQQQQQQQRQQRMPQLVPQLQQQHRMQPSPQLQQQQFIPQSIPQQRHQGVHPQRGASSMQPAPVATQGMMGQMSPQRLKMTDESMHTRGQSIGYNQISGEDDDGNSSGFGGEGEDDGKSTSSVAKVEPPKVNANYNSVAQEAVVGTEYSPSRQDACRAETVATMSQAQPSMPASQRRWKKFK